ncbi:MAG TPA: carboxypeptidase-like regulatory domain-containing protein, partial [Cyclobacteriaceae bacterium]|nr:carboxypeptidase-like regulatory domain-containing protein [Cyclobacteriaceae bacterium]
DVSWYIYQGSQLLQKGFGKDLDFKFGIEDRTQTFYLELLYTFGGTEHSKRMDYEFKEDYLNVSLDVPDRAYPGQKTEATITVMDQLGRPVGDVDLTAMAVTGKLNYYLPDLPYYGNTSTSRSKRADFTKDEINERSTDLRLDYARWAPRARLDTMKYYQFTYPTSTFSYSYGIADSTQFAPYVMQKGAAKRIYVIEVDRKPVYYSWVDQPKKYSFYVPHKKKCQVTVRLFDRVIIFDSIQFARGKKTIISIDIDHLPVNAQVQSLYTYVKSKKNRPKSFPSFTKTEVTRHLSYLAYFKRIDGDAYLESEREFIPLFRARDYSTRERITVGPVTPGRQVFNGPRELKTVYHHTGGFTYAFEDNIVYKLNADRLIPERLFDDSDNPMTSINDLAITKKIFLESTIVDKRWYPRSINLSGASLNLKVLLPEEKAASGFFSVLFENCVTKKIVSPCQFGINSYINSIPHGLQNLIALYNNGTFLKIDSVNLKSNSKVLVDMNETHLNTADSISRNWLRMFLDGCQGLNESRTIYLQHSSAVRGDIRGVVYDDQNTPMPGVNVIVKGTTNGTSADADGRFSLDVDESTVTLVFSFIGMMTQEFEVQVGSEISVYLQPDVQRLSEVVVVGYSSSQRKSDLSFASVIVGSAAGIEITTPDKVEVDAKDEEKREAEKRLYGELLTLNTIRSQFSDVGFWEPRLYTDKSGKSKFGITFPDDITRWKATVYAMNKHLQTGTARKSIRSYKPIAAELLTPQFLTQGDSSLFLGKVSNFTEDKTIKGKVKWSGTSTSFEKDLQFSEFNIDRLPVNAMSTDTVTTQYLFTRDDGYVDGEERKVPIIEQGVLRADGTLSILRNQETASVKATSKQNITVELLDNPIDIYAGDAKYLLNYKYDCNEQLASKLLGFLSYRLAQQYEGKPFKYDKDVNKIIGRLLKNQNTEFLWSWWDVSHNTSYWISAHILRALNAASDAGYKVALDIDNISRKAEYKFLMEEGYSLSDADLLQALALWNAHVNYAKHVAKLDTLIQKIESAKKSHGYRYSLLKHKLLLLEVRQLAKLPYQRDSLLKYQKNGIMGEISFSDDKTPGYWYDNQLTTNSIAYRILKKDSALKKLIEPMQMYFLAQRKEGPWNTYHSSNVLMNVLPDLISDRGPKALETKISLSGKVNSASVKLPYKVELHPQEELQIKKESGLPIYLMQYKWDRVTTAKTGVEGFEIKTWPGNNQSVLQAGKPVILSVEVNVKKEAATEYVMIEVPIPAGCSYTDKSQNYYERTETHREYFKEKTVIFCEKMKSGKYWFEIKLLPRFTGMYVINPAQVSLMYVPVVNANTDLKKIRID